MPRYRKKPVVIEARQYDGGAVNALDMMTWSSGIVKHNRVLGLHVETLEGVMVVRKGDWVIRGVKGEYYPCKPDIFAASYDEVTT